MPKSEDPTKDPNEGGSSGADPSKEGSESPEIAALQEQIENLSKGIGKYRDEAQDSEKKLAEINSKYEKLLEKLEKADDDDEDDLDTAELKKFEKFAKKHGLVTKEDLDKESEEAQKNQIKQVQDQAVAEFLESNPEFDNDEEWKKVQELFQMYRTPTSLTGFRTLFSKIKKDLKGEDKAQEGEDRARAQTRKRDRLSLGGGSQKSGGDKEQTIESLQDRYPNLSRGEIEARLNEIKSLYPDEK